VVRGVHGKGGGSTSGPVSSRHGGKKCERGKKRFCLDDKKKLSDVRGRKGSSAPLVAPQEGKREERRGGY